MAQYDALLKPLKIRHLTIRNRVMSTSHAPAYAKDAMPQERYQLYREEKAKGGIGLTDVKANVNQPAACPLAVQQAA